MSATLAPVVATEPSNATGYRSFRLGKFELSRDEYFVSVRWPAKGARRSHQMPADAFLRACMRDVAWNFFYGWVNFDSVIGTRNHYGKVDFYAGTFNGALKEAGVDYLEQFDSGHIMATFKAILRDWVNQGFDPFAAPVETGTAFGPEAGRQHRRHRTHAHRHAAHAGPAGRFALARRHAGQPRLRRRGAGRARDPRRAGLRGRAACLQPVQVSQPLRRHLESLGHRGVQGLARLPDHRGVHPAGVPRQRPGGMVRPALRRDRLGRRRQEHRRAARPRHHEGGRRRRHAGRHPPPGLLDQALDALRLGERHPRPAAALRKRRAVALSGRLFDSSEQRASGLARYDGRACQNEARTTEPVQ